MTILKKTALTGLVLGCAAALAAPGQAGSCGYQYCWGAVAIGPAGQWGYAYGQGSEGDAVDAAQGGCNGGCTEVRTFYNTCAAIAVADNGGWGWATESTRELAESSALSYCMDHGRNCRTRVWSCSR